MVDGAGPGPSGQPISAVFAACANFVIDRLEGGGSLVDDSGGATRWGISKRGHPDVDVASLTREGALVIYHARYWLPVRADELPRGLDLCVYDAAVNLGVAPAVKLLQRVLRVTVDGVVGPATLSAARAFRPQSELRALVNEIRLRAYEDLAGRRPSYVRYLYGWRCRVMRLADEAGRVGGVPDPVLFEGPA